MKKILMLLLFSFSLFFTSQVEAAEILQQQGGGFSSPTVQDNKVRINLSGGNVKYIRHTKYEQSSWTSPVAYKQLKASSTFTGFAYSCPGYYMTRIYSDSAGTKLIGWVRVYVSNSDINNAACAPIVDTSKAVPPTTKKINVTHPSDVVKEPSKMINNSTIVSASAPVTKDTTDEDLEEFVAGSIDPATLSLKEACDLKNQTQPGRDWQLRLKNGVSWECVDISDCMYNNSLWYCNAPTLSQKYPDSTTTIDNPDRDQYNEDSCSDATASNCLDMYTMSNYSRPTNNTVNVHTSDGGTTTEPTDPTQPTQPTDPENPNADPVMEEKCSIDANFESDECIQYRFCLDSPEHPDCKKNTAPPTENVCFPGGEPDFSNPDCHFNCAHSDLMDYEECTPDTSYFQDMRYCWTEEGEFKWDSPYCDFMNCEDDGSDSGYLLSIECGGPVDCMDYDATEQRLIESRKNLNGYGNICGNLGPERGDFPFGERYYQLTRDNCNNIYGETLNRNPGCTACYITNLEISLGVDREPEDHCPDFPEDVKGGLITEVAELLGSGSTSETDTCACEGELGQLCCIFECPGWDEYLGFITDTVEMAIGDITTPEVEPIPEPEIPETPETPIVDKKQLPPPTGREDPALGDSSFDANDLKDVEEIPLREDPGGFNIVNPLEQLDGTATEAPQPELGSVTQPQPTGGNASSGTAQQPQYGGGTATAPTTGGTAQQPDYSGSARVPTYNAP